MALKLIGFPLAVFVAGLLLLNWLARPIAVAGETPLYLRWEYNDQGAKAYWKALDQQELLSIEALALRVDLLFPLLYGGVLLKSILTAWSTLGRPWVWSVALIVVLIAVAADWTENLTLLSLLQSYVNDKTVPLDADLVHLANTATKMKFFFIGISWVALLGLVAKLLRNGNRT